MKRANQKQLYKHVETLCNIRPFRNYQNLESLKTTADYIQNEFQSYGYSTRLQQWEARGNIYENIITSYQPEKKQKLIVGAHYDVCGDQPGADDNASAVAGLLETARLINLNKPKLDYGIEFVAYCLEEPPFFGTNFMGSYVHAESLYNAKTDVLGMVCYEMIGYFSDAPASQNYPTKELRDLYPDTANFIIVVGIEPCNPFNQQFFKTMKTGYEIDVQMIEFENARIGLASMSEQMNYWEFNYNVVMINDTSFLRNPNYHLPSDTIEILDFDKMRMVVDSTYNAIIKIS